MPGFGGTQRLPAASGRRTRRELIFSGDDIGAAEALRIGLVNAVVAPAELMATVQAIAGADRRQGAARRRRGQAGRAPGRRSTLQRRRSSSSATLFALLFATADQKEGMRAFLEKRARS